MDLIRYPVAVIGRTLAVWCTDCNPEPADDPIWTEDDAAEQVTELCLANLVAIAEEHEREHHADDQPAPRTPPPGSYWTDLAGKVWDLSCQYLDRHHREWRIAGMSVVGPLLALRQSDAMCPLSDVEAKLGPLVAIPPKVELTHYGNGTHGGPAPHKGERKNCPAPECCDAEADERDEETHSIRALLDSIGRYVTRYPDAEAPARTELWRELWTSINGVSDLFRERFAAIGMDTPAMPEAQAELLRDHSADDGKPRHCYPRCAAEG